MFSNDFFMLNGSLMMTILQKHLKQFNGVIIFLLCLGFSALSFADISPAGEWKTISDHSGKPASIVKLWVEKGELKGKVMTIFKQDGNNPTDVCKYCKGERFNQPIEGMIFLWGMTSNNNVWSGGSILDPKIGKIYRCRMTLTDDGNVLHVRGYIGFPLLGRTQTWYRVSG